jgi:hypothetical protein
MIPILTQIPTRSTVEKGLMVARFEIREWLGLKAGKFPHPPIIPALPEPTEHQTGNVHIAEVFGRS